MAPQGLVPRGSPRRGRGRPEIRSATPSGEQPWQGRDTSETGVAMIPFDRHPWNIVRIPVLEPSVTSVIAERVADIRPLETGPGRLVERVPRSVGVAHGI